MRLYLFDLDDTLVSTVSHACQKLYPRVARKLGCPIPATADIRATWGKPLDQVFPSLFGGTDPHAVIRELQRAHQESPPPPIPGVVRRLTALRREGNAVVIFSAGNPDIVRIAVKESLGMDPDEQGLVYSLPRGRRLLPVDIDIIRDSLSIDELGDTTLVFSDTPEDRIAVSNEVGSLFYGLTSGVLDQAAHVAAGTPSDMIYEFVTDALDAITEEDLPGWQVETSDIIGQLQAATANRQLVVFLGAGVSADSGLPTGAGLVRHFGERTGSLERLMTAQGFDPAIYSELHRVISDPQLRPNKLHRALALLDAPYYIGTNWDHLLERAFKDLYGDVYEDEVGVAFVDAHLPEIMGKRNAYIKIHGDISRRDSLVFDFASYARRLSQPNLLDKLVEVLLNSSAVLFIGYSVSDINVIAQLIEHRLWEGAAPPPRFAIMDGVDRTDRLFLRSAGIKVIDVVASGPGDIGTRTFDVLARLHDAKEDFASDAQLMSGHPADTPIELFYQALTYYQESQFTQAAESLREARENILDWRRQLPLLARFSYLTAKLYDKLEEWGELENLDRLYFTEQFRRVEPVMPGVLFAWMQGHYRSALALAALRAGEPETAFHHIEPSIEAARRQPSGARLLLTDRRVVRAIILQYLARLGRPQDLSAIDDLAFARGALGRWGGLDTTAEVHFAGRFYGATAFVALTYDLDESERIRLLGLDRTVEDNARRSHANHYRVPYGVVAGRYCESYYHYESIRRAGVWEEKAGSRALSLLDMKEISAEIGPSVRLKCELLKGRIQSLMKPGQQALSMPDTLPPYAAKHIGSLGIDGWLGTPLN